MRKRVLKVLAIVLATIALCMPVVNAEASAYEQYNEALAEKQKLESALAQAKQLVNDLKQSKGSVEEKVKELDGELNTISSRLSVLEGQLNNLNGQITDTQEAIDESQALSDAQYAAMKRRIQYIYENGRTNYIAMFAESANFADFLNTLEYVMMISEYDRDALQSYADSIHHQRDLKSDLEAQKASVSAMEAEISEQKNAVKLLLGAKNSELKEIEGNLSEAEEQAKVYEQEVAAQNEILEQIKRIIASGGSVKSYMSASGFYWPCPGYTKISSDYGPRTSPTAGASTNHKGVDMAAPYGTPILAAQSGVVQTATYSGSAGNYIIINHGADSNGNIVCTVYMHASALLVSEGQTVTQGQTIAQVGSTGYSTGNHLHFGVTVGGSYVSPWNYISRP